PHGDPIHAVTDPAFRRAMRHAVDSSVIAEKVFGGYATPADSPVEPTATTGNWDPRADQSTFDIPLAKQPLAAAGYKATDGAISGRRAAARTPTTTRTSATPSTPSSTRPS